MINLFITQGNLTDYPTLQTAKSGKKYLKFTVACNQGYGVNQKTDFINCVAFDTTATFISNYFIKGSQILIQGQLHNNNYTDKNGVTHYTYEVTVSNADFCGNKNSSGVSNAPGKPHYPRQVIQKEVENNSMPQPAIPSIEEIVESKDTANDYITF